MTKKIKINPRNLIGLLLCLLNLVGCATAPAPINIKSGNSEFARLLETIRQKENLPAIAASVIIDGDIYAKAAVAPCRHQILRQGHHRRPCPIKWYLITR